jgi:hypothetical protein
LAVGDAFDEGRRHVDAGRGDVIRCAVVGAQVLDEAGDVVGAAAFADEHDLAGIGIGHQREIALAAPIGRLVDGNAGERRQVGLGEGKIDIAAANRMHPMPAFADRGRDRGKWHLLGEHQHQRLEQQGEAGELTDPVGLDQRHLAVRQLDPWHPHFEMHSC